MFSGEKPWAGFAGADRKKREWKKATKPSKFSLLGGILPPLGEGGGGRSTFLIFALDWRKEGGGSGEGKEKKPPPPETRERTKLTLDGMGFGGAFGFFFLFFFSAGR